MSNHNYCLFATLNLLPKGVSYPIAAEEDMATKAGCFNAAIFIRLQCRCFAFTLHAHLALLKLGSRGVTALVLLACAPHRHPGIACASCSPQVQHRAAPSPGHPKVSELPPAQQGTLHGAVLCCRDLVAQAALPLVHSPFAMLILSSTCSIRAPVWQVHPLFLHFPIENFCSPWHVPLFLPLLIPD